MSKETYLQEVVDSKRVPFQQAVMSYSGEHPSRYPWRRQLNPPYHVLVGEMWLERHTPLAIPAYDLIVQNCTTIKDLADSSLQDLEKLLAKLYLHHHGKYLSECARKLVSAGGGDLPRDADTLARITGLPRYRIMAVFCFGYGLPVAVVDMHVSRLLSRVYTNDLPQHPAPGLMKTVAANLVAPEDPQGYNGVLLDTAELICLPEVPLCSRCPLQGTCDYNSSLRPAQRAYSYPLLSNSRR